MHSVLLDPPHMACTAGPAAAIVDAGRLNGLAR